MYTSQCNMRKILPANPSSERPGIAATTADGAQHSCVRCMYTATHRRLLCSSPTEICSATTLISAASLLRCPPHLSFIRILLQDICHPRQHARDATQPRTAHMLAQPGCSSLLICTSCSCISPAPLACICDYGAPSAPACCVCLGLGPLLHECCQLVLLVPRATQVQSS
jgi:hypothetical protein